VENANKSFHLNEHVGGAEGMALQSFSDSRIYTQVFSIILVPTKHF